MKYLKLFEANTFEKDVDEIKGYLHDLQDLGLEVEVKKQRGSLSNIDIIGEGESDKFSVSELGNAVDELMNRVQDLGYKMFLHEFHSKGSNDKIDQSFLLRFVKLEKQNATISEPKNVEEFIDQVRKLLNLKAPNFESEWPPERSGRDCRLIDVDLIEEEYRANQARGFGLSIMIWEAKKPYFEFACPLYESYLQEKLPPELFKKAKFMMFNSGKPYNPKRFPLNSSGIKVILEIMEIMTSVDI